MSMLDWIDSLSLARGALVIALVSGVVALAFARLRSTALAWTCALLVPVVLAPVLYWTPVWSGENAYEYRTWIAVFLVPWWLAGLAAASVVLAVARRRRRR
jgi:hypothetical protein